MGIQLAAEGDLINHDSIGIEKQKLFAIGIQRESGVLFSVSDKRDG